jgi:hypothetical protein
MMQNSERWSGRRCLPGPVFSGGSRPKLRSVPEPISQDRHPGPSHAGPYLFRQGDKRPGPEPIRRRSNQWLWLVESFAMSWRTAKGVARPIGVGCFVLWGTGTQQRQPPASPTRCCNVICTWPLRVPMSLWCNVGGRGERDADMGGMRDGQSPSCRLVAVFAPSRQASRFLRTTR